jgi:vacuolar-type H+-ATPase subunit E/Vma4
VNDQSEQSQTDLIEGIARDGAEEANRILSEAEKTAEDRRQAAEDQARALIQQEEGRAEEQAERILAKSASSLRMEHRRAQLKLQEQVFQEVLKRVRGRLAAMVGSPEYRQVLLGWIVEAAIGLGAPQASVNASAAERKQIDKQLLREAQEKINAVSGRKVLLILAQGDPLLPQGVVLTAPDGRVEFNNQVATRMLRRQSEIRKTIQDAIWKSESSDR